MAFLRVVPRRYGRVTRGRSRQRRKYLCRRRACQRNMLLRRRPHEPPPVVPSSAPTRKRGYPPLIPAALAILRNLAISLLMWAWDRRRQQVIVSSTDGTPAARDRYPDPCSVCDPAVW